MTTGQSDTHITNVSAIGIPVVDQDRAIDFYVGTLGFEKRLDVPFGPDDRWVEVAPAGALTSIALMRSRDVDAVGIDTQVRLTSEDAEADHAAFQARGVDTDPEILRYPVPMFSFRDPDGNRLIVVERPHGQGQG